MTQLYKSTDPVYGHIEGVVGTLYFNRAQKRNAMTTAMWQAIPNVLEALEDAGVRVIIVRSKEEGAFSAGADIAEIQHLMDDPARTEENRLAIRAAQGCLADCPCPTIAVIGGDCFGGGCGIALHTDMRLASTRARFAITPAKLGLVYPLRDSVRLVELVGAASARRMLYTAETLDATEAHRLGLIDWMVESDVLDAETSQLVDRITSLSPVSLRLMKEQMARIQSGQRDDDDWSSGNFVRCHQGDDMREGVAAFLGKRPPDFKG